MTSEPIVADSPFNGSLKDELPVSSPPRWWRRAHSYVFASVVLGNVILPQIIAGLIAFSARTSGVGNWVLFLFLGIGVGQLFLLGVWIALGGLRMVFRILLAPLLALVASALFIAAVSLASRLPAWGEVALLACGATVIGSTAVWMLHATLLPLRWLLGWRVDFDPAYHPLSAQGTMQVGIKHFFIWTIICALPFALARTINFVADENKAGLPLAVCVYCAVGVIIALLIGGPLSLACLAQRHFWLRFPAALTWCGFLTLAVAQLVLATGVGGRGLVPFWIAGLSMGCFVLTVAGNLLFLRLFGLQLFSVKPNRKAGDSEPHLPVR